MNDQTLRRKIAGLVSADSANMILTSHAKQQMKKRKVTDMQVLHVLKKGLIVEGAHLNIRGNWQCTLGATIAGDRIKVAAALWAGSEIGAVVVITVMN